MRLRKATDSEKRVRDWLCHPEWGQGLTAEAFARREEQLRGHPWSRQGMSTWLWLDDAGRVLASCETFRTPSALRSKGAEVRGHTYAVASVFTEPALRGRGHASAMMQALVRRLAEEDPLAQASILFSDVGAELYARAGYVARPGMDWVFPPLSGDPAEEVDRLVGEAVASTALAGMAAPAGGFAVLAPAEQLDWHLERERIYARELARPRPVACGAQVGDSRALWAAVFKTNELVVLRLDAREPQEARRLVRCARRVAFAGGLTRVRWWETPLPFAAEAAGLEGARSPRQGELPMLCPLATGVRAEQWEDIPRLLWV